MSEPPRAPLPPDPPRIPQDPAFRNALLNPGKKRRLNRAEDFEFIWEENPEMCEALASLWGRPFIDSKEESPPALRKSTVTLVQLGDSDDDDPDTSDVPESFSSTESSDSETTAESHQDGHLTSTSSDSDTEPPPEQLSNLGHHAHIVAVLSSNHDRPYHLTPTVGCIKKKTISSKDGLATGSTMVMILPTGMPPGISVPPH